MDPVTPFVTAALLALFTAIQVWINKGRFDAMDRRIDAFRSEMDGFRSEIDALRSEMRHELAYLRTEIAAVRSDLFQVVLRTGPESRPKTS